MNYTKVATPMNSNEKLQVNDGSSMANVTRYKKIVGGLFYLAHTRLHISCRQWELFQSSCKTQLCTI